MLRDKLFTEEQYLIQLSEYENDIKEQESEINNISDDRYKQGGVSPYVYLLRLRVCSLVTKYSMGKELECLKIDYLQAINAMKKYWTPHGYYVQMLWLLSIGIMLDYEDDIIQELLHIIDSYGVEDRVYDILLNYRFPKRKKMSNCVFDNIPYHAILDITDLAKEDKCIAVNRLEKYLKKEWY